MPIRPTHALTPLPQTSLPPPPPAYALTPQATLPRVPGRHEAEKRTDSEGSEGCE